MLRITLEEERKKLFDARALRREGQEARRRCRAHRKAESKFFAKGT